MSLITYLQMAQDKKKSYNPAQKKYSSKGLSKRIPKENKQINK